MWPDRSGTPPKGRPAKRFFRISTLQEEPYVMYRRPNNRTGQCTEPAGKCRIMYNSTLHPLQYQVGIDKDCKLMMVGKPNAMSGYGVAFPKGSDKLVEETNRIILDLQDNGELGRLRNFWLSGACHKKNRIKQSSDKLGILNFTSAFILLATGILVGGVLLIFEHTYFRFGRKCLKKYDKWGCCALVSLSMGKSLTFEQSVMDAVDFCKKHKCKDPLCETQIWKVKHELDLALLKIEKLNNELSGTMTAPIKVCRQRFESDIYWTPNKTLGKPLIINVKESRIDKLRKRRDDSDADVQMLKDTLPKLGFDKPVVIDEAHLTDKRTFFGELERIAQDESMRETDAFMCVIMGFGDNVSIYLKNEGEKVEISDIVSVFKSDHCHRLVCKPKIFIVHTDYHDLRKEDRSLFTGGPGGRTHVKVPVEADIILYHSQLAAKYTKDMVIENYRKLVNQGLVLGFKEEQSNGGGDTEMEKKPGTHFIFTLCKAAESLHKDRQFDLLKLIFRTNEKLQEFLDSGCWKPLISENRSWTIDPKIPFCNIQLTKNLIYDLQ
ncbi:hypothetical protein FSP39_020086 [Pinctada imbricata]|uniref:Caspase family p20 domain-containing protein n=1 Tax=Pinctada imbricata TaxID=66713 RepID=A0AA88Y2L5_PINIB|nr:hypothetical protein FSP39_020086 [Pinctada imbricata]